MHCFPPLAGAGFVQVRVLICSPLPHVFEQVVQFVQLVHCPSTV